MVARQAQTTVRTLFFSTHCWQTNTLYLRRVGRGTERGWLLQKQRVSVSHTNCPPSSSHSFTASSYSVTSPSMKGQRSYNMNTLTPALVEGTRLIKALVGRSASPVGCELEWKARPEGFCFHPPVLPSIQGWGHPVQRRIISPISQRSSLAFHHFTPDESTAVRQRRNK